jgi:hypothetical protein
MKTTIIASLFAVLLVGCNSMWPIGMNDTEEATLHCIRQGSWEPLGWTSQSSFSWYPGSVLNIENQTGAPLVYDFMPRWGNMDNCVTPDTSVIFVGQNAARYIPVGAIAGIAILEPYFFRDGALLKIWKKSAKQEDPEWVTMFDILDCRYITGKEMQNDRFTVTIGNEANKEIQPTK